MSPGGRGYLNAVNPFTGGRLGPVFNVDGDSATEDMLNGVYPGSIDLGNGKPGEVVVVNPFAVGGGSDGTVGDVGLIFPTPAGGFRGRISWREIVR